MTPREKIIQIAAFEVDGNGDPTGLKYMNALGIIPVRMRIHWCGIFCLWCFHQAGVALDVPWKIGKGFCYRLKTTKSPQPGDVVYFASHQHHALVYEVDGTRLVTLDGNQGAPDPLRRRERKVQDAAAFYSIQPWIDAMYSETGEVLDAKDAES